MNKSAIPAFPGAIKQLLKKSELYRQTVSGGLDSPGKLWPLREKYTLQHEVHGRKAKMKSKGLK